VTLTGLQTQNQMELLCMRSEWWSCWDLQRQTCSEILQEEAGNSLTWQEESRGNVSDTTEDA